MKRRLLYICVAIVMMAAMTVSAFAQELPVEEAAAPQETVAPVMEEAPKPIETASETTEPEVPPESTQTGTPEATVSPLPVETSTPAPAETPVVDEGTGPVAEATAEAPAEENQAAEENLPAPTEEPKPAYDAPAIFLGDIVAKGDNRTLELTDRQLAEIEKALPQTLSSYRREVVMQAYSLVGKVNYFWGGKSTAAGWDSRWGNEAIVGSDGSVQTGTTRTYGLDCSGYVLWSFLNAEEALISSGELERIDKTDVINKVGYGTAGQWELSAEIPWEEAQPGDLAFYGPPSQTPRNHVGIVVGKNEEGQLLVAHCSSTQNNVVISKAEEDGFRNIRALKLVNEREEGLTALELESAQTMPNGAPMFLTQSQAYEGAVKNGWSINE